MKKSDVFRITVDGGSYPCRVTMGALLRFKRETGRDVSEIGAGSVSDVLTWLWCCVCSACAADGVSFDYTLEAFADRVEPGDVERWVSSLGAEKKSDDGPSSRRMSIEECTGIALGCVGLSLDDFMRLSPEEYRCVVRSWEERTAAVERGMWERMRLLATITVQPHVRRKITARELLPFTWDSSVPGGGQRVSPSPGGGSSVPVVELSRADRLRRLGELVRGKKGKV